MKSSGRLFDGFRVFPLIWVAFIYRQRYLYQFDAKMMQAALETRKFPVYKTNRDSK